MSQKKENQIITDILERPLQDLRLSLIDRCNLRCPYCMPKDRIKSSFFISPKHYLSVEEIERLASIFVNLGIKKIRLTGGEPLLRKEIIEIIQLFKAYPHLDLALTTNGTFLNKLAPQLFAAGLKRITISLDSLNPNYYKEINGRKNHVEQVLAGIKKCVELGISDIKINCVLFKGIQLEEIMKLVDHFRHSNIIVRFIEYMDVGQLNNWQPEDVLSANTLHDFIHKKYPLRPLKAQYTGEVAKRFQYKDGQGEIGFISSISKPFCRECNRLRISADGQVFTCLFGESRMNLKQLLQTHNNQDLQKVLKKLWRTRIDRYSELRQTLNQKVSKAEMSRIGG